MQEPMYREIQETFQEWTLTGWIPIQSNCKNTGRIKRLLRALGTPRADGMNDGTLGRLRRGF